MSAPEREPHSAEPNDELSNWDAAALLKEIEAILEPDRIMSPEAELVIVDFLTRFNVRQVDEISHDTINIIWTSLGRNPQAIKDFTYLLMNIKTGYYYSEYPMPVSVEEIVEMSDELKEDDRSPRIRLVDEVVVPNIARLGYDGGMVRRFALSESSSRFRRDEVVRFLGWLVGQGFIQKNIDDEVGQYLEANAIKERMLSHLVLAADKLVRKELLDLKGRDGEYRRPILIAEKAQPFHEDVVHAMIGINNMCKYLFRRGPA